METIDALDSRDKNYTQIVHQILTLISLWAGAATAKGKMRTGPLFGAGCSTELA